MGWATAPILTRRKASKRLEGLTTLPYSAGREDEQASRARRLEAAGALRSVPARELGTGRLLEELVLLAGSRPAPVRLDLDGARTTARVVTQLAGLPTVANTAPLTPHGAAR